MQTERKTLEDKQIQPIHPVDPFPMFGTKPSPPVWGTEPGLPSLSLTAPAPSDTRPPGPSSSTSPTGRVPWQLNTGASTSPVTPQRNASQSSDEQKAKHPGPISLPPFPNLSEMNPLSPLQTRGLPPMTPSMPGFVFNAYPSTPPAHPQFLSPGAGPFSPGLPVTSPIYNQHQPFLNAAPGAPVVPSGSAALSTPTTQAFPNNQPHSAAGPPGAEYFPRLDPDQSIEEVLAGSTAALKLDSDTPTKKGSGAVGGAVGGPVGNASKQSSSDSGSTAVGSAVGSKAGAVGSKPAGGKTKQDANKSPTKSPTNGRSSLDESRAPNAWNMDRRASWSEVAAGTK